MAQGRISGRLLRDDLARDTNLTFDTNTLVVDYGNSKVGIGTVSTTDILTVAGNATVGNLQFSNNQVISVNANAHIVLNPNGVGNIDVSSTYINNLADPAQAQDAATKAYVDSLSSSIGNLEINDTTITSVTASDDITIDAESGTFIIAGTTGFVIPVGNTSQRAGSPSTGETRYNSETGALEVYDGSQWDATGDYTTLVENFDGDDSTVAFTLSSASTTEGVIVDINGVLQLPTTAYSVSSTTLTFTQAPASGDKVTVRFLTKTLGSSVGSYVKTTPVLVTNLPSASSVGAGARAFVTDASATTFASTVTGGGANSVPVYSDGANWKIG